MSAVSAAGPTSETPAAGAPAGCPSRSALPDTGPVGRSVGLREVNQRAGQIYREVEATGQPVTVTDRGRPIAQIVPIRPQESRFDRLMREGRIQPATRSHHLTPQRWDLPEGMTLETLLAEDRWEEG
ncbi:type II toxin-antitoxin system Phd/YefM family antitoxin [Actinomyces capricornis]|uniref:Antitoxin n=1 Tax=Actinomyces capricornis TaxID=2755559 RepID=A0ABM7UHT9_9ACTO|nr:type II toxin-antitoxin system prevent-host-death family antitoxin [Actinomyces capricornis]BDA64074.1 hypothetical protein MANAM107_09080 [Actinomyces capricornis]